MASEEGDDIYDDVASTPQYNGHISTQPQPPPVAQPRFDPSKKTKTLPVNKSGPPIPTRAPTTGLTQTMPKQQQQQKKGKGKKETKQAPPRPVSGGGGGGLDMSEILRKRQNMNTNRFENLEKPIKKNDEDDEKQLAPWQLEKKKIGSNKPPTVAEHEPKVKEDDVPEFIKKRRSMSVSLNDSDDDATTTSASPPQVAQKPSAIKPIKEENNAPVVVHPKPKPAPRPAPKPPLSEKPARTSPPLATKPKPTPPSRKDSLPIGTSSNSLERNAKPPVHIPPKPGSRDSSPKIERHSENPLPPSSSEPPSSQEDLPPPPFKPPTPSNSPPTVKARPRNVAGQPPSPIRPNVFRNSGDSPPSSKPPVTQRHSNSTFESSLKHLEGVPPKPTDILPPKPVEELPPKPPAVLPPGASSPFKPPAPLPPVQSQGEPTPSVPSVVRYRRLPLPAVDINNPPPLPSRAKKPSIPAVAAVSKRAPLIPTESQEIDEDIYDDTVAVTGTNEEDDQDIYDDTIAVQSEITPMEDEQEELYDDVSVGQPPPPSLPSRPPKLPPVPSIPPTEGPTPPVSAPPPVRSPAPTISVPPIPVEEEQEDYEEPGKLQVHGSQTSLQQNSSLGSLPPVPPSPGGSSPRSTLPLPQSAQQTSPSPQSSPTLQRKNLTKEEKKQLKEEEKRMKEQKRLDALRDREMKKRDEQRAKNRQKSMKAFKDYKLPEVLKPLFSVEVLSNKKASKDHMAVVAGERMSVILITHEKLPRGKLLVEKEDGTIGLVDEHITERTVYQSAQQLGIQQTNDEDFGYGIDEDIYEALETEVNEESNPPSLPPMNTSRQQIPEEDEPQDVYEFLPDN